MPEVRVYVEGGGDSNQGKREVRQGFADFLRKALTGHQVTVVACGGREATFDAFQTACRTRTDARNVLLVDSEGPVGGQTALQHLRDAQPSWDLGGVDGDSLQMMVQVMETWLIADADTLAAFYGQGFRREALPAHRDPEAVSKRDIEAALRRATERTTKGAYRKIQHGARLVGLVDVPSVRAKCHHCERLISFLGSVAG